MKISTTLSKARLPKGIRKLAAAAFWLVVWQLAAVAVRQEILVASPVRVFQRLWQLASTTDFWMAAAGSMGRVLLGFCSAVLLGSVLAVLTARWSVLYDLFHPLISLIKATPVASFIILALVWIPTGGVPSFASFLMVLPLVWGNIYHGIQQTDNRLLQMSQAYCLRRATVVRRIYLPSIMPYLTAACTSGMGLAWKAGVAAEVLANTARSAGGNIYSSKIYLETTDLFAWTAVVIALSVLLENGMVWLMRRCGKKYNAG